MFKKCLSLLAIAALTLSACSGNSESSQTGNVSGKITIDGSSTVAPITEAIIEEFQAENDKIEIAMGISGTGGGFKKFTTGETEISNASRKIKAEEKTAATEKGIEYYELEVAKDAISVVVNKDNTWAKNLTKEQLQKIWLKDSTMNMWSDIDPSWPQEKIKLYGPGTDSGTYDYFNEVIIGKDNKMRADFTASEDDNTLVTGISGDKYALGYFGYAYYEENKAKLTALSIDSIMPTAQTVQDGTYTPLSRALYIYVNKDKYKNDAAVKLFVDYYLDNAENIAADVGYPALEADGYTKEKAKLK